MIIEFFHKTGERYRNTEFGQEHDGDDGYTEGVEVSDSEVRGLLADFILSDYDYIKFSQTEREKCKQVLTTILYDEVFDSMCETYYDRLVEYYQSTLIDS